MSSQDKVSTPRAPRCIAVVVRDGMDYGQFIKTLIDLEQREQVQIYVLASRLGSVCCHNGQRVAVDATLRRWSGARFDEVYVMHANEARLMKTPLIEEVFTRAAQCAGAMVVNLQPRARPVARPVLRLPALVRLLAPSLVMGAMWAPVHAQQVDAPVVIDPAASNVPYVIDTSRTIVRSGTGQCVRTGTWTLEAAANTKVAGSDFPAGCYCDKPLLPKAACEPKVVIAPPLPPQPVPVPPPPPPVALVPQKVSVPADALFAFDKANLTADGRSQLSTYASQLKTLDLESVVAVGHTDRIGSDKYNQKLSERRAAAVKAFLVEQGVPAEKVYSEGKGESQPVTGDKCAKMGPDRAANHKLVDCLAPDRRVDIEAVGVRH